MAAKTTWTLADYLALDEPDGPRHELSDGELIVSPSPTFRHNQVRDLINLSLRAHLHDHPTGVVTSETDFQLGSATVRRPDVAFILQEHFQPEYERQIPIPIAPDLVWEVVSEHDRPAELLVKTGQYLSAGTAAVWLLYPEAHEAHLYQPGTMQPAVIPASGDLQSPLLPGWSLALSEILPSA